MSMAQVKFVNIHDNYVHFPGQGDSCIHHGDYNINPYWLCIITKIQTMLIKLFMCNQQGTRTIWYASTKIMLFFIIVSGKICPSPLTRLGCKIWVPPPPPQKKAFNSSV